MQKLKENPNFSNKKIKISNNMSGDDSNIVKRFLMLLLIIALVVFIFYLLTDITNNNENVSDSIEEGTINYEKVTVGTIFNRPYDEYYVIAYDGEGDDAVLYSLLLTQYTSNSEEDSYLKIYYCDLNNKLNSDYVSSEGKGNKNADSLENLSFGDITLIKIKNKKIVSYTEGYDLVKEALSVK